MKLTTLKVCNIETSVDQTRVILKCRGVCKVEEVILKDFTLPKIYLKFGLYMILL